MTPLDLRTQIPGIHDGIYLNYGAHGPSPQPVVEAAQAFLETHEYAPASQSTPYETATQAFDSTRESIAGFLGVDTEWIGFTESTTAGINAIAGAIEWQPGDIVVRTDVEHPAGILPWERLKSAGVKVRVVETTDGRISLDDVSEAIDGARLVCMSALTWTHGTQLPVEELVTIAREQGVLTLIDAVQVPGQIPLEISSWDADIVAAAGHKWLLGTWGAGFLAINPRTLARLEPRSVGFRSVAEPDQYPIDYHPDARRFEIGTANPAPYVALEQAIQLIESVGVDTIQERIAYLAGRVIDHIPDDRLLSPERPESGLVTIAVDDPEKTVERLRSNGIVIRSLPSPRAIRLSVHAVNTAEEIDRVTDMLADEWK